MPVNVGAQMLGKTPWELAGLSAAAGVHKALLASMPKPPSAFILQLQPRYGRSTIADTLADIGRSAARTTAAVQVKTLTSTSSRLTAFPLHKGGGRGGVYAGLAAAAGVHKTLLASMPKPPSTSVRQLHQHGRSAIADTFADIGRSAARTAAAVQVKTLASTSSKLTTFPIHKGGGVYAALAAAAGVQKTLLASMPKPPSVSILQLQPRNGRSTIADTLADINQSLALTTAAQVKALRGTQSRLQSLAGLALPAGGMSGLFGGASSFWPKAGIHNLFPGLEHLLKPTLPAWLRHAATRAAMRARLALIEGLERWEEVVDNFTARLGFGNLREWREAVSMALIGDWVDLVHDDEFSPQEVLERLRREAKAAHVQAQPLWERMSGGGYVWLLDTPLGRGGVVLGDVQPDAGGMDTADRALQRQFSDPRVQAVLAQLSAQEQQVALTWAFDRCETWEEAAAVAGAADPRAFGIRVRRKLKRLGRQRAERMCCAASTRGSQTGLVAVR
ncbi:hypothetical protein [Streptomyces aureus]